MSITAPTDTPTRKRRPKWATPLIVIGSAFVGVMIASAGDSTATTAGNTASPVPTVTVTGPAAPASPAPAAKTVTVAAKPVAPAGPSGSIPEDGTFLIGADVKAGTYRATGGDSCYWARLKNTDGGVDSIIANGLGGGAKVVTVKASDEAFETRGCGAWKRAS